MNMYLLIIKMYYENYSFACYNNSNKSNLMALFK